MNVSSLQRELRLSSEELLAFERAYALHLTERPRCSRRDFANFLISAAANAYAVASQIDRTSWWTLELRPLTPEEKQAEELLDSLRRQAI